MMNGVVDTQIMFIFIKLVLSYFSLRVYPGCLMFYIASSLNIILLK